MLTMPLTDGIDCGHRDKTGGFEPKQMPDVAQAQDLISKIRQCVQILKRGPREAAAALLAMLFFAAAKFLPASNSFPRNWQPYIESSSAYVRILFLSAAVLLLGWSIFRIWKQATPPAFPVAEARPAPIKGPMPFTPEDGPLFRRLCREDELGKVLGYLLDNQIPLVVLMG